MKRLILLLILFEIFCFNGYTQDTTQIKTIGLIVKADLFFPTLGLMFKEPFFCFSIEKTLTKRQSIQLTGIANWHESEVSKNSINEIVPEYRFYVSSKSKNNGLFIGGYFKYSIRHYKYFEQYYYESQINIDEFEHRIAYIGGFVGYQTSFFKRLNIDFLLGLGSGKIIKSMLIQGEYIGDRTRRQNDLRAAINIGFIF